MALQLNLFCQPVTESVSNLVWRSIHDYVANREFSSLESVRTPYTLLVGSNPWHERASLYDAIQDEVKDKRLPADALLPFIYFEPHPRLIASAVKEYLESVLVDAGDHLKPVAMLIAAVKSGLHVNPGAVLASIVHLGDRRFNALARVTRDALDARQIRRFARTHCTSMTAASVEFCLDWLVQLQASGDEESICYVASSLMLMPLHDESGIVRESNPDLAVTATQCPESMASYQNFEVYLNEVMPTMEQIRSNSSNHRIMDEVILIWRNHSEKAQKLRAARSLDHPRPR